MKKGNEGHSSALYVWNGLTMFWGTSFHTDPHSHNTLQLIFDIDKKFQLKDRENDWRTFSAAIIRAGHMHQLDSSGSIQLLIYLDADSDYGKRLTENYLADRDIADLADTGIRNLSNDFFKKLLVGTDCDALLAGCQIVLDHLLESDQQPAVQIDERILKALDFISHAPMRQFKIKEVAEHVCLSESRLRHLFKKEVGQPIQNFMMWMKVVDSLNMVLQGKRLAQAAVDAGFWDGSHMNRSYKELLGIPPGQVKAYEKTLRIVACGRTGLHALRTQIYPGFNSQSPEQTIEI